MNVWYKLEGGGDRRNLYRDETLSGKEQTLFSLYITFFKVLENYTKERKICKILSYEWTGVEKFGTFLQLGGIKTINELRTIWKNSNLENNVYSVRMPSKKAGNIFTVHQMKCGLVCLKNIQTFDLFKKLQYVTTSGWSIFEQSKKKTIILGWGYLKHLKSMWFCFMYFCGEQNKLFISFFLLNMNHLNEILWKYKGRNVILNLKRNYLNSFTTTI